MGKTNYYQWLNGCGCQGGRVVSGTDACSCDNILLEISNLHTDDEVLQNEIDDLSGDVENKLDASAYTPVDLSTYATKEWVEDKGYLTTVQPLKTINGESLVGEGNITISGGSGTTIDAYTKTEADERFQPIGDYLSGNALSAYSTTEQMDYAINAATSGKADAARAITDFRFGHTVGKQFLTYSIKRNGDWIVKDVVLSFPDNYLIMDESGQVNFNINALSGKADTSAVYTKSEVDAIISGLTSQIETLTARINNCCGGYPVTPTDLRYTGTTTANTEISLSCCTESGCNELVAHDITETSIQTGNLKTINVGDCITIIGTDAFTGETNLTTVILPSTVVYIRGAMLANCTSIANLKLLATTPPTLNGGLLFGIEEQIPSGFKIYVPSESVNTYKQATGWSTYASYIESL